MLSLSFLYTLFMEDTEYYSDTIVVQNIFQQSWHQK